MGASLNKILPQILVLALICSLFSFQQYEASAATDTTIIKSQSISFKASEKYNENSSLSNFSMDLTVPSGYKPKSYQLWMMVADSNGKLKLTQQSAGSVTSSKLLLNKINGTKIKVIATGIQSDMYAVINRRSNGKQWVIEGNGVGPYNVTPKSGDACWSTNLSICPGLLPAKDDNGVMISGNLRASDGWIKAISDGVDAPVYFTSPIHGSSIYKTALVQSTVNVTKATPVGLAQHRIESKGKGVSGKGQLTVAIPPVKDSYLDDYVCSGCSGNAIAKRYVMQTDLDWSAETYYYEGEVRVTYEPIPPVNTPTVSCDCSAEPDTITFADKDVPVTATLTASLSGKGTKNVKNWTVYGRADDGSQYTTSTVGYGLDKIEQKFSFTILKAKLNGIDSYTETWVLRARVNFTDGTTAEQPIECTTTVTKLGAATPDPGGTPTPPPAPPVTADIEFIPNTIITGDQSTLDNNSDGYTSMSWTFSNNLQEVIPDDSQYRYPNLKFDKPGFYQAKIMVTNGTETRWDTASLQVLDPKPVAVVTGPTKVIQGRDFSNIFHLYNSYTPLSERGVTVDFTKNQTRYKKVEDSGYTNGWPSKGPTSLGQYSVEGKVFDSQGRESDWGTHIFEVVPDQPPIVSIMSPEQTYRFNESMIYIDAASVDGDVLASMKIEERYDHDNDGNYEEEPWTTIYEGPFKDTYPVTYTTVGKRQYRASVAEDYGLTSISEIAATNVLNYSPFVNFDVYGLTQQPDQGDDSAPEDLAYSGESIMRSWKLIQPYTTNANKSIGWKTNNGALLTKNAKMADFFIKYPNMGLGANSRSRYEVAADLTKLPVWGLPKNAIAVPYIYAGHRLYSREGEEMVERNAKNGAEISRFSLSAVSGLTYLGADKNENFYYGAGSYGATNYEVKKINNQGQLIGSYTIPISGEMSYIMYFEVSDDGQNLYMAYRARTGASQEYWNVHAVKYSVQDMSVKWDVKTQDIRYSPTFLQNYKGVIDSDGDLYLTWATQTTYDGYEVYAMAVNGDTGVMGYGSRGASNSDISYMTATTEYTRGRTDKWKTLYFNVSGYVQYYSGGSNMNTTMYGYQWNRTTGALSKIFYDNINEPTQYGLEYWETCKTWCDTMSWEDTYGVGTPIIYPDGTVYATTRYQGAEYYFDQYLQQIKPKASGNLIANTKAFLMPSGNIAYPTNGAFADYTNAIYKPYASIVVNGRGPIDPYNNTKGSINYYNEVTDTSYTWTSSFLKDPTLNTSILPDGSFYGFSAPGTASGIQYVFPFVPSSGSGDYPKVIDANTVEVVDATWAGLWYDPATKLKNDRLSFNVAVNDAANDKPIGAAIHIQDGKNMYAAEWTKDKLTLFKVAAGTKTALQSVDYPRSPFVTYPFELEASNGTLCVYINHAKLIEISDTTYRQGSLGILSLGQQQAKYSDVKVKNYGDYYVEETHQSVLVGEEIKYETIFDDIEKDPELAEEWSYLHDPNYFANSLGESAFDGKTFEVKLPSLDKPGLYHITLKAKDSPGMDEYEAWSEPVTKELYVHRRPIARPDVRFTGIVYPEGETLDYAAFDTSYDPDIPDYLADRMFRTRWADETAWTAGKRELYTRPGVELIIQEQVQDGFGVWSYWAETRVYKEALPAANQHRPQMIIAYPGGTLASPTLLGGEPVLRWTYSDADRDPQEKFYLKVSYVDNGAAIMEGTFPGNDTSFILDEGIKQGRKVKVQGRVYSKGYWSDDSNIVYFILNTPPVTHLLSFNGAKASEPIYTNNNRPLLKVSVTDVDNQPVSRVDYEVFYNAGSELAVDTNSAVSATSYTTPALREGLHNWRARASDSFAWGGYSENGYFFVDTVPPNDTNKQLEIKPTSVKVTFNPFSDAAPSSGHASRAFYMQKVNEDGSTTNIDLNSNGTAEYSISLSNATTSYTVGGLLAGAKYRLMVVDWDIAGNMGQYEYIYFSTNRPPTADFDWSPKPVYEGDTVVFMTAASDPDNNDLSITYKLTSPTGVTRTFAYSFKTPYPLTGPSLRMTETGDWTMLLSVSDGMETVQTEKKVKVLALGLTGYVKHTEQWDEKRKEFNKKQSGKEDSPRGYNVFWAGEKFLLSALTTNTGTATKADRVEVAMKSYSASLTSSNSSRSGWQGELWEKTFNDFKKGPLIFEFTAYYNNGIVRRDTVTVQIEGNVYDIVGVHRVK
ncbi:hypothetical protein [Paenibacillus sp. ATY16]|uniref:hypothetical protein n=1 Tax=Paenibacillus sp. ATY16 TaxID=1759312 RepID=UPI00200E198D|nr:hypothetical protein [Paenibacillus sp. ATY16]MCK9862020.1 hypothetical protein [Paenibacillus sp. ATY16]